MIKYLLIFYVVAAYGCADDRVREKTTDTALPGSTVLKGENIQQTGRDSLILTETYNQEDIPVNEYLKEELQSVRDNFKRINSIKRWDSLVRKELDQTTELGEATLYYANGKPEKIIARNYGETFQQLTEYYLLNNELSFVFEKEARYNRPIDYDSADMRANNDSQIFNYKLSEVVEDRSYFLDGKLVHQLNNQDCGAPFADDYLRKEEIRIKKGFYQLTNRQ